MIRKGSFSFEVNYKLSIFPIPTYIIPLFFTYVRMVRRKYNYSKSKGNLVTGDGLTNMSNVPYTNQTIHK
jgi:hypothetical protein